MADAYIHSEPIRVWDPGPGPGTMGRPPSFTGSINLYQTISSQVAPKGRTVNTKHEFGPKMACIWCV